MKGGARRAVPPQLHRTGEGLAAAMPRPPQPPFDIPEIVVQGVPRAKANLDRARMPKELSPGDGIAKFIIDREGREMTPDGTMHVPYQGNGEDFWTIGYGHNLGKNFVPPPNMKWTEQQALAQLKTDMAGAADRVHRMVEVPLTQAQFDALTSLAFNTTEDSFLNSRMLKNLNAGNYLDAATEMLTFDNITKDGKLVRLDGLTKRRRAEAEAFLEPWADRLPPVRPST